MGLQAPGDHQGRGTSFRQPSGARLGLPNYVSVVTNASQRAFGTVRVDPTTLGTNDHHGHLEESLGYPRPPTLPQNSIGNLRGDVRPDLCQSGLSTLPFRSVWCHSGLFNGKQPKPDPSTVQPDS
ncbi:hypothetical protein CDL15_Pgr015566 [Punica granatum]|uniref:Uncharacterized protein n=1 Tax=Punica granatum TaxID=22663 RepID=A0A218W2N5_PUNGR|nr:hypothetical protein CDL15_Pgr015566 [Punica granatum]